jgi:hypothetical protein
LKFTFKENINDIKKTAELKLLWKFRPHICLIFMTPSKDESYVFAGQRSIPQYEHVKVSFFFFFFLTINDN